MQLVIIGHRSPWTLNMAYIIMQFCNLNVMHHNTSYRMQKFHCNNEAGSYSTLITQHYKCARNFSV